MCIRDSLDENGERIRLPSGNWKSHKEDTVDWNEQYHAEAVSYTHLDVYKRQLLRSPRFADEAMVEVFLKSYLVRWATFYFPKWKGLILH